MKKAIGIYREIKLAGKPGSDQKILDLVAEELRKKDFEVQTVFPDQFDNNIEVDLIFTMARGESINQVLMSKSVFTLNSPQSIRFSFDRKGTYKKMIEMGANIPETNFYNINDLNFSIINKKSILKPANRHEFWFVVENEEDFNKAIEEYKKEGIEEIVIQDFIEGDHVKYYVIDEEVILPIGIENNFSENIINQIKEQAILTGKVTGLKIFGGDFIVTQDNAFCVDANDWPSFGSIEGTTQEESAIKIANFIIKEYVNR
ncbi:MAG: ATP-grasp domain-containing protein [Candidatus Pacebacteria bacterium]|nr:ATP-grasp domain-containing protein [Candidatus Paceibacterota bacterium]MDD5013311.1 ATP-grasp domain-containing protein [Candidatus Paceibacterota bacterium]MDD5752919.1 ATP-grasp domain-containing protein [Candidatus Paceibacterota bacterium]